MNVSEKPSKDPGKPIMDLSEELELINQAPSDPLAKEIAKLILYKRDLTRVRKIEKYKDDPKVYQVEKKLGLFLVIDRVMEHDWVDTESGFVLKAGEQYLDLHLPSPESSENLLSRTTESFQILAKYIEIHKLSPKYILGITYEELARFVGRFGFRLIEPPIPDRVQENVRKSYNKYLSSKNKDRSVGRILVCYQTLQDFKQRFPTS